MKAGLVESEPVVAWAAEDGLQAVRRLRALARPGVSWASLVVCLGTTACLAVAAWCYAPWRDLRCFWQPVPGPAAMPAGVTAARPAGLPLPQAIAVAGSCLSLLVFALTRWVSCSQQRALDIAHQAGRRLRLLERGIDAANEGVFILDATHDPYPIIFTNPAFLRITGYTETECKEPTVHLPRGDSSQPDLPRLRAALKSGCEQRAILREFRKNGTEFWAEYSLWPVHGDDGRQTHYVGIVEDVTSRKQAEEQLAASQAALQQTVAQLRVSHQELEATQLQLIQAAKLESVGTLAAGVAHEVKNPLQTIIMGLDFLTRNLPGANEALVLTLTDMRDAVQRANSIVRELLHFSAVSTFDLKEEDLHAVITRSLWLVNNELKAARIRVVRELASLPLTARFDRVRLEQVFVNLFINAAQAMAQGGTLTVRTRSGRVGDALRLPPSLLPRFQPGESLAVVEVQDNGPGIPEEHLERIFDPFFTTKPSGVGTGLGLSIVRRILDLHGGAISVSNVPTGGVLAILVLRA
jgi:PAS domain S-box-containing protein